MHTKINKQHRISFAKRAVRKVIWLIRLSLQKTKHHLRQTIRYIIGRTLRHPYLEKKRQIESLRHVLNNTYGISNKVRDDEKSDIILLLRDGNYYPKSSAFIRLIAPLSLPTIKNRFNLSIADQNIRPDDITNNSIYIVQRTVFDSPKQATTFLRAIKKRGAKLIIDNDDAFSLLDSTHSEHSNLGQKSSALELLAESADEIWVSTPKLAELNPDFADKTIVMPNTLDERLWKPTSHGDNLGVIRMIYMGTATHDEDFKMIIPALDAIHDKYPGSFELYIIGISPATLPDKPWLIRLYQPRGHAFYPRFVNWFLEQGSFDVGLCPLVRSAFNDAKSDIKCLDYIAAGIHPVASNVPSYQTPELKDFITLVNNYQADWENTLTEIVKQPEKFRQSNISTKQAALEYLRRQRSNKFVAQKMIKRLSLHAGD